MVARAATYTRTYRLLRKYIRNGAYHYVTGESLAPWRKTRHNLGSISGGAFGGGLRRFLLSRGAG